MAKRVTNGECLGRVQTQTSAGLKKPFRSDAPTPRGQFFEKSEIGLMTLDEVAFLLGKKTQTIRNWIAKRQLPYVRVGNKNLVLKMSLLKWLERKEIKSWE